MWFVNNTENAMKRISSLRTTIKAEWTRTFMTFRTLFVAHLCDLMHFFFGISTRRLSGITSLISLLFTHRGQILHAVRTIVFAVTATPRLVIFLTLWIIEERKSLTVWERLSFSFSSPIPSRLHTVRGEVFILWRAVLAYEQA